MIDAGVQGRVEDRLVAKGHIHVTGEGKPVEQLEVGFRTRSRDGRFGPDETDPDQVILQRPKVRRVIEKEVP